MRGELEEKDKEKEWGKQALTRQLDKEMVGGRDEGERSRKRERKEKEKEKERRKKGERKKGGRKQ